MADNRRNNLFSRRRLYRIPFLLTGVKNSVSRAYSAFSSDKEKAGDPSEWFLDNYYIVQLAMLQVREDMNYSFHKKLPLQHETREKDSTRIFRLCREIISGKETILSLTGAASFLIRYQKKEYLTTGELWAIPVMLRLSVLIALSEELDSFLQGRGDGKGVSSAVLNLRKIQETDWSAFFEAVSPVERTLKKDPAGIYRKMDFATRDLYRNKIESLSEKLKLPETETAETAVALAAKAAKDSVEYHIGWYLITKEGEKTLRKRLGVSCRHLSQSSVTLLFVSAVFIFAMLFAAYPLIEVFKAGLSPWIAAAILFIPAVAFGTDFVFVSALRFRPAGKLPKMDYSRGIPDESRTIIVIPSILSSLEQAENLLSWIERHYLSNSGLNILFGILTDLRDADFRETPEDLPVIEALHNGISQLNELYASEDEPVFYLFHRNRLWNPSENKWMGWERKRGKLEEFNRLLLDNGETSFMECPVPEGIQYVITLDSDTVLSGGAASVMTGAMAHPLNRYNGKTGYTVMQPRALPLYREENPSLFFRVFSGDFSVDLYSNAVSDLYQDVFGEGIYMGKGIYDLRTFTEAVKNKIPENSLLSHDLFEGLLGRAAYLSDVVVYEDFPGSYTAWRKRQHRWIRGDWQLLPWLFKSGFSLLDRWKIADNMRRSLTDSTVMLLLLYGWFFLGPPAVYVWTAAGVLVLFRSQLLNTVFAGFRTKKTHWVRAFLETSFLPVSSSSALHGISVTLWRVLFSGKNLLQWTSAEAVSRHSYLDREKRTLPLVSLFSISLALGLLFSKGSVPMPAVPFLVLWAALPGVNAIIAKRRETRVTAEMNPENTSILLKTALRTWHFFDYFTGPEDHWLPPDHYQEDPLDIVAHRTSPTNIGLFLLSVLAAADLGFLGVRQLLLRVEDTLDEMKKLSRCRGHLLNWYSTKTLEPLNPRYVSTVDSGNLLASLVTLKHGLDDAACLSPLSRESWQGLETGISIVYDTAKRAGPGMEELLNTLEKMEHRVKKQKNAETAGIDVLTELCTEQLLLLDDTFVELLENTGPSISQDDIGELRVWSERLRSQLSEMLSETETMYPWLLLTSSKESRRLKSIPPGSRIEEAWKSLMEVLPEKPSPALMLASSEAALKCAADLLCAIEETAPGEEGDRLLSWSSTLEKMIEKSISICATIMDDIERIKQAIEAETGKMDFSFLYNKNRKVFRIGFNVDTEQPDANCYDLLASEARLASLLAIAYRDVPFEHWLHLARPFTSVSGMVTLISWSGTMFEYLMPLLFTGYREETLLGKSCAAAVKKQIDYGRSKGIPWGISESGYYRFDQNKRYQYMAFGVPGLGYKRGLEEDTVVTPYASFLALPVDRGAVLKNLESLSGKQMTGRYGFYEAIDFTTSRLPAGKQHKRVRSYMAHHQGMILLSILNSLQNGRNSRRFHREAEVNTVEILLHEASPENPRIISSRPGAGEIAPAAYYPLNLDKWVSRRRTPARLAHHISNGSTGAVITDTGRAFISWNGKDVTDVNSPGDRVYIKDMDTGWFSDSCAGAAAGWYPHMAEYLSRMDELSVFQEVIIAPECDCFVRKITVRNNSSGRKKLFLCSVMEPALAETGEYTRHPEFNRLFISSSFSRENGVLLLTRRKRGPDEKGISVARFIPGWKNVSFETDRELFTGRGCSPEMPVALRMGKELAGHTGTTVDPLMVLGVELNLKPSESSTLSLVTICGGEEGKLLQTAADWTEHETVETVFHQSQVSTGRELAASKVSSELIERMQPVLSSLLFPTWRMRAKEEILSSNILGQKDLWKFGISGDVPVLLVSADTGDSLDLLKDLLAIHRLWRGRGLETDLVILNEEKTGYQNELQGKIHRLLSSTGSDDWIGRKGGIFPVTRGLIEQKEIVLLKTWASAVLKCSESLQAQTSAFYREDVLQPDLVRMPVEETCTLEPVPPPENLLFFNGYGGFTEDGREYVIYLENGEWLPRPWINVMAGKKAGITVSESGIQCLWVENSGENRLIPWRNDPLEDSPGMALYIRDEETGAFWSPTPLPARDEEPYLVKHSAGYTVWKHNSRGLAQTVTVFTDPDEPAAALNVSIRNAGKRNRRIGVTVYAEPVLGSDRAKTADFLVSSFNTSCNAVFTKNTAAEIPPSGTFFVASSRLPNGLTTDRKEFLGRKGSMSNPSGMRRTGLSGCFRPGRDPCVAIEVMIWIGPGEEKEVTFLAGQETSDRKAVEFIEKNMPRATGGDMLKDAVSRWDSLLDTIQADTPDKSMNLMVNRWLLYQTLSCRILGRTALYQSSGAFGFRDQLQDILAVTTADSETAKKHILESASKQFIEGDVLHWWHPPLNAGVRTRCSDDLLWLPYAVAEYVRKTGDKSILREKLPYLQGDVLAEEEMERYDRFPVSVKTESLHRHCMKAIEKGLTSGSNGFPLMGSHDWNDGMNLVGNQGRGESVWLGWFLYSVLTSYSSLCSKKERAALEEAAEKLKTTLNEKAWDGKWYLRGFYDDGHPLGSQNNSECMIDSIAQSWAVISKAGDKKKNDTAMNSVMEHLVNRKNGIVLLFTPPFNETSRHPGYIMGYPPGVRENGGQYTHAAIWTAWALAETGRGSEALQLFRMMNPVNKSFSRYEADVYRVEPYAVAADVCSSPECPGRGGWTWYTGASGWMYRLATEAILGIGIEGNTLVLNPCVAETWKEWKVTLKLKKKLWNILFTNPDSVSTGIKQIKVNDKIISGNRIELSKGNADNVVHVVMGNGL